MADIWAILIAASVYTLLSRFFPHEESTASAPVYAQDVLDAQESSPHSDSDSRYGEKDPEKGEKSDTSVLPVV